MPTQVFLTSDTHFNHSKMYELPFRRANGEPLRPWNSSEEADEELVRRWNAVVTPSSKVYHLGDVTMGRRGLETLSRLNGTKILISGNHQASNIKDYLPHFKDIRSYSRLDSFLLSHVPVHPDSLGKSKGNIHGHLHYQVVRLPGGRPDPRYLNVCVEHTDYTPIAFEDVQRRFAAQQS